MNFSDLKAKDVGEQLKVVCIVEGIEQTAGPTVFQLNDGTGMLKATAFGKGGKKAFPEIRSGDCIEAELSIKKRRDALEGELLSFAKKASCKTVHDRMAKRYLPESIPFMIVSDVLEKMRPGLMDAAGRIRAAIYQGRQILIRHHADCDGYSGAIALERAIMPLLKEHHRNEKQAGYAFRRSPSRSPYYDYPDVLRDMGNLLEYGQKPLIILVDLGALEENLSAIKRLKIHEIEVIVLDHHNPDGEDNIRKMQGLADLYINPYAVGFDSSLVCGMICSELARMVNKEVQGISFLPALAGTGDKSDKQEFEEYLKISGMDREYLKRFAMCVDFETHYLRFQESRQIMEDLFAGREDPRHEALIDLISGFVDDKLSSTKLAVEKYVDVQRIDHLKLIKIDCEKVSSQGEFPNSSKIVRIAHELFTGPRITVGIHSDQVIFRVTDVANFNVNDVVGKLQRLKPHALIDGGGHEFAGTLTFVSGAKEEVLSYVDRYIKLLRQRRF